jgi:hypothetical protein
MLCATSFGAEPPTQGLVAYYPLDGNANDVSGNQLHGTAVGTTPTFDRDGKEAGALAFDGDAASVDCGNPSQFNFAGSFTISAWVKLAGNQINTYVVSKYDAGVSTHSYGMGTAGNSLPYAFVLGNGPGFQDVNGVQSMNDGAWHAIVFVYDVDFGIRLYLDGRTTGTHNGAAGHPAFQNDVPLMIGRTFSGQPFAGAIDDVRLYNRALSSAEVVTLGPPVEPPVITITAQPQGYRVGVGNQATLQVSATVNPFETPTFQWFKNGEAVLGATGPTYTFTSNEARQDVYKVRVEASTAEKFSDEATVTFVGPADAKLLLHYTFENDTGGVVTDSAGNFHGEAVNTQIAPGRVGVRALRFDGSAYVRAPYAGTALDLVGTPYTIAFWMKSDQPTGQHAIVSMQDGTAPGGYAFLFTPTSFSWLHWSEPVRSGIFRPSTNWAHVALVWDGINRSLFVNGILSNRVSTTRGLVSEANDDLFLGAVQGVSSFYRGLLDDFRIYSYALAADEIQQLGSVEVTTPLNISLRTDNLVLTWPFSSSTPSFRVEYTDALSAAAIWTPASGVPKYTGDLATLTQPRPASTRFYRLRRL